MNRPHPALPNRHMKLRFLRIVPLVFALCLLQFQSSANDRGHGVYPNQSSVDLIKPSKDKTHFVSAKTGKPFSVWGVNYDRDDSGRLLEDYWDKEWATVVQDFREIKDLGANVVRVHLQLPKFMDTAERPNRANLARLAKLVHLAEQTGLYLDVTGLGCYHKQDVPQWYDQLSESERWKVQARFWEAVAKVCRRSNAIFCYDLMNEPVVPGGSKIETEWLAGQLAGKYYVQRIALDPAGRTTEEIARAWVNQLTAAIRKVDDRHMITVGAIPWIYEMKATKPLFYSPTVNGPLDFVSVHFYPRPKDNDRAISALKAYDIGKPLVVEEIYPFHCSVDETADFIQRSRAFADGWISFYWGKTIEQNENSGTIPGAMHAAWLRWFRSKAVAVGSK